jgi:hypothetical protein
VRQALRAFALRAFVAAAGNLPKRRQSLTLGAPETAGYVRHERKHGSQPLAQLPGPSPDWYKKAIIGFLVINPILLFTIGPFATGWVLIAEFIFTLALALRCYPLQPGGLLAIEAVVIGMTSRIRCFTRPRRTSR